MKVKLLILRILLLAFLAGIVVCGFLALPVMTGGGDGSPVIFLLIAVGCAGITGAIFREIQRTKRSYCKKCGEKYNVATDIGYEQTSESESKDFFNQPCLKASVDFECRCHNCGAERTFTKVFITATMDKDGRVTRKNLRTLCDNYLK
jgi:hypothetical protein